MHEEELRAIQAQLDRQLAQHREIAETLNVRRQQLDALEDQLHAAGEAPLEVSAPIAPGAVASVKLPAPSWLEGHAAQAMRRRIEDTQRRILELEKVVEEVNRVEVRKREAELKLRVLNDKREFEGALKAHVPGAQ